MTLRALLSRVFVVAAVTYLLPANAFAQGSLLMSWDPCPFAVRRHETLSPGYPNYQLHTWITGQSNAHFGFKIRMRIEPADGSLPDAWRFDVGSCQLPGLYVARHHIFFSKCVDLASLDATSVSEYIVAEDASYAEFEIIVSYPQGTAAPNPAGRYIGGLFTFDHSLSVYGSGSPETCGGLEEALCFRVLEAGYYDSNEGFHPWILPTHALTASGSGVPPPDCDATPVEPGSWGRVKVVYR